MEQMRRVYVRRAAPLSEAKRVEYAEKIMGLREKHHITQKMIADELRCSRTPIVFAQQAKHKNKEPYLRILSAIKDIIAQQKLNALVA